jgi:hypothetical protein
VPIDKQRMRAQKYTNTEARNVKVEPDAGRAVSIEAIGAHPGGASGAA